MKKELEKLISEAEWKLYVLPDSYCKEYFEEEFIPQLKEIIKVFTN